MRFKRTVASRRWTSLAASLAMFALLCATIAYWVLQLLAPAVPIAPTASLVDQREAPDLVAAAKLFGMPVGGRAGATAASVSNIQVLGVAASEVRGSAVLVVDGKQPKAYMVGDKVTGDTLLVEVQSDVAVIERNGVRIELVAPQRPSVAILSGGPVGPDAATAATTPPVPAVSPRSVPLQPVAPQSVVPQSVAPQSVPPLSVPPQPAAFPAAAPTQPAPAPPHVQLDGQAATQAGTPGVAQPAPMPGTQPDAPGSPPPEASGGAAPASRP
jgi:general secretion pathway protein C